MKRLFIIMISLLVMLAGQNVNAQEVTVDLLPGWNYIAYPFPETVAVDVFFSSITPTNGDMIKSFYGTSSYINGRWRGAITVVYPGVGYHYYSNNPETVTLVWDNPFVPDNPCVVTTSEPSYITAVSAVVGGNVTLPEGYHVFSRGVCWGTEPDPDIDGSHTSDGTGVGEFSIAIYNLLPETTYYVRAYAISDFGLDYGDNMSFTTLETPTIDAPIGAIDGKFTINENGNQVYFSQGNLQYIGSANTPYWKFAEHQWDYLGTTTGQNSEEQNVDRDLFGWGTSGYDHGAICYQPWSTSIDNEYYNVYGGFSYNLCDQTGQADWGYNPISNGGNQTNQWRTLTKDEWVYMFNTRSTISGIRYAKAEINGVNGVILLPDDWSSSYYSLSNTNTSGASFSSNTISVSQWNTLEQHGAVFLPAAGNRYGTSVNEFGSSGAYWSSTSDGLEYAYSVTFGGMYSYNSYVHLNVYSNRGSCSSVRLVCSADN